MRFDEEFNIQALPASSTGEFSPLPDGWYDASISTAEIRDTKNGTGKYLNVRYDIQGPTHAGRVVFGRLNIRNQNPKAEEIGRQQMGDLMRAIGLSKVTDTDQFVGHNVKIKLTVRKSEEYGDSNDIKAWKANGSAPAAAPAPAPKAASKVTPPWAKK